MKEKVCLFIGSHRPSDARHDSGEDLVRALINQDVNLSAVYVRPDDPLRKKNFKRCRILTIPKLMRQPRKRILKSFQEKEFSDDWKSWIESFVAENYSLGVVYFGSWLPPDLFNAPKLGFINFHPGPLPALRGFEAETWAILTDMHFFYGTVHRVNEEYDEGEIIWRSPLVKIRKRETPDSLLKRTCYAGINHIQTLVKLLHKKDMDGSYQKVSDGISASVKLVSTMARIEWHSDSLSVLDRKNRAFNGQYISVPFVLKYKGADRIIRDILALPGRHEGGLGQYLGRYEKRGHFEGKEMFQALDGIVVIDMLPLGASKPNRASVFANYNDGDPS